MAKVTSKRRIAISRRLKRCGIRCVIHTDSEITNLSDFFGVFAGLLRPSTVFWFRGHSKVEFTLCPSALRYTEPSERDKALSLIEEMKRFMEMKLPAPPGVDDRLAWAQIAQHYGLPTRLLDWTLNAAVALFFACAKDESHDGVVVVMNPIELNQNVQPSEPHIFTTTRDGDLINKYLSLDGHLKPRGRRTIAINPTWNTERIAIQHGVFTLHGDRNFELHSDQARSLVAVPILREHKSLLLDELQMIGIGEMFIFPEPEHVCSHLKRWAKL